MYTVSKNGTLINMLHRLQNNLLSKVMFWANWSIGRQICFILGKNESKNLQEALNNVRGTVGHTALKKKTTPISAQDC